MFASVFVCVIVCCNKQTKVKGIARSRVSYKYIKKAREVLEEGVEINLLAPLSFCRICFSLLIWHSSHTAPFPLYIPLLDKGTKFCLIPFVCAATDNSNNNNNWRQAQHQTNNYHWYKSIMHRHMSTYAENTNTKYSKRVHTCICL